MSVYLSSDFSSKSIISSIIQFVLKQKFSMTLTELLESVRRVEVRTNRLVNDTMVGAYLSGFKGRGMDFEELREYMPGDDVCEVEQKFHTKQSRFNRWPGRLC